MACGSGCCGPPKDTRVESSANDEKESYAREQPSTEEGKCNDKKESGDMCSGPNDTCCQSSAKPVAVDEDNCCGTTTTMSVKDDCCSPEPIKAACEKDCCASSKDGETSAGQSGCCNSSEQAVVTDISCKKGCCSTPARAPASTPSDIVPSCCVGKLSPCCDSTCIDRLALRECKNGKSTPSSSSSSVTECTRGKDGRPCSSHSQAAKSYYQAKLDAFGCICRVLLALGQESCCIPTPRSSTERKTAPPSAPASCCSPGGTCSSSSAKPLNTKSGCDSVGPKAEKGSCADGCCSSPKPSGEAKSCADDCCDDSPGSSIADACADACCRADKSTKAIQTIKELPNDTIEHAELEKGLQEREHIILSISGMTCTGCETKLKRTLGTLTALTNLKTSLVLSRTEFDIDPRKISVEEVIKHLHRTTEFKCERVSNQGSTIDFVCECDPADIVNGEWPDGVVMVKVSGKNTISIEFDPKVIGARDLLHGGWKGPMQLAPPRADLTLETSAKHVRHLGYMTLLSAILTIPVLVMAWAPLPKREIEYASASLALATMVQVVIAGPFYPKALKALVFSKVIEMDLLIVLSTSAAYIFSVVSFGYLVDHRPLSTGEFFETSTLLVTLIMVGRFVAALARQKAVESISIRSLQTPTAVIIKEDGSEEEMDARLLQYGDVFTVLPETRLPTDGTVISGSSEVDESMLTGESKPVEKDAGSPVVAGSVNGSGALRVRPRRLPGENTISTIAGMVDEAKLSKPKIQDIADRVASFFVPVVIVLTILTFVTWVGVGVGVRKQSGSEAVIQAITYAITVLIVSCPCAIGLAVPMVIVIASGVAADRGVIFKTAESIEIACRATDVVFDKTGTLTEGKLSVVTEHFAESMGETERAKSLLLGLIRTNKHPVSVAVAAHLLSNDTSPSTVLDPKNLTGKGVEGTTSSGDVLRAGNSRWLDVSSHLQVKSILSQGYTAFCFTINGTLAAVYGLNDSVRGDAVSTVSKLREAGIETHILSGDDDGAVRTVAAQLEIPDCNTRSRCSPGDKQAYIQELLSKPAVSKAGNRRAKPVVLFCGDGTNDAVALAQASIGVHMNEGTDVAQSAADVVLMRPSLGGVVTAIAVSKKSMRRVAFNFGWSFVYNLFAVLLAAGAFVNARIPPEYAGLGELVSVLPVIAAALLLRWSKI